MAEKQVSALQEENLSRIESIESLAESPLDSKLEPRQMHLALQP
jgi:hypothetical protein